MDIDRVARLLGQKPLPWSELADIGHRTRFGVALQDCWRDYRRPDGYASVREIAGLAALFAEARDGGFKHGSDLAPFLRHCPRWRYLSRELATGWAAADAVEPAGITFRLPYLVLLLPQGVIPLDDGSHAVALCIQSRPHGDGIELAWAAVGDQGWGLAGHDSAWHSQPEETIPSRIAWGAAALLSQEPEEVEVNPASIPCGIIRRKAERPAPVWLAPPIRRTGQHHSEAITTRGPVTPHWRAGHVRRQPYGKGRKQRRLVAIPPLWIGQGDLAA